MAGQPTFAVHISLTLRPKSVYSNLAEELLLNLIIILRDNPARFAYSSLSFRVWGKGGTYSVPVWSKNSCGLSLVVFEQATKPFTILEFIPIRPSVARA